ncbi:hypothetical protein [Vibrio sp. MEBiC08052]|uniref:hypothetical protein n=1 Tax=Vibrio sp. MEBiC08052 TaxID=1761910 RepID=UPI0007407FF3|nr:hypothetical protein [Vibrio sp. MEBiC08052]KUI99925.1 hypothetical protein VRK_06380 [Vibrio sp. MEBiC08052]
MKLTLIRPNRADIKAQLALLRPAFNRVPDAKYEYMFCCDAVTCKRASFYQLKGKGVAVRFVGYVTEQNEYLILALTGKGLKQAAPVIIDAVRSQGYQCVKYHTVRQGMTRILKRFGFVITETHGDESVLCLQFGGVC